MSFLGDRFEYDLFVSYPWSSGAEDRPNAELDTDTSKWVQRLVSQVATKLRQGLSTVSDQSTEAAERFKYCIDKQDMRNSGVSIGDVLREATQKSAFMLVLVTPDYLRSDWCKRELEWFLESANRDGRGQNHFVIREMIRTHDCEVVKKGEVEWPSALCAKDGKPLQIGRALYDPANAAERIYKQDQMRDAASDLMRELYDKFRTFKKQLQAKKIEQVKPCFGVPYQIYLERHRNPEVWRAAKQAFSQLAFVNPDEMTAASPEAADEAVAFMTGRRLRKRFLPNCQGLVMLRQSKDDHIWAMISDCGYSRREALEEYQLKIPWVLVDYDPDNPPDLPPFFEQQLPRIEARDESWPQQAIDILSETG